MPPVIDTWSHLDREVFRDTTATLATMLFNEDQPPRSAPARLPLESTQLACGIQGIAPIMGQRVRDGRISFGAELDAWFIEQAQRNLARLKLMRDELLVTLDAFDRAGITIVPLKGSAMILDDLAGVSWRPMADLDVLVRHPSEREIDLAFAHAGYCLHGQSWKHRTYGPCDAADRPLDTDGEHPGNPRDVESHSAVTEMFRGFRWDITPWITNNLQHVDDATVPSPQAMALHLAVHLSIAILEGTARMIHIFDFARAVDLAGGVTSIRTAVEKSGIERRARFVYPAVALAARWTAHPTLGHYEAELRPHVTAALAAWLSRVGFQDISWAGREHRGVLDRLDLWAGSSTERLRMLAATVAPTPSQLASAGYPGKGPITALGWYPKHYRHLVRRMWG